MDSQSYEVQTEIALEKGKWQWIRLGVRNRQGEILGYMNPIFQGNKIPEHRTFGEIKKIMDEA